MANINFVKYTGVNIMINAKLTELPKVYKAIAKQYNYASAVTLTKIAIMSQKEVRDVLPSRFTMRNQWIKRGIRVQSANKKDMMNMYSKVYSIDWFMAEQEKGTARNKGKVSTAEFSIPTDEFYKYTGRDKKKRIPKSMSAQNITKKRLKGNKPFRIPLDNGDALVMVYKKSEKKHYVLYYLTKDSVDIHKRAFFFNTVDKVYSKNIGDVFSKELKKAISSMRI